jgi:pilus assembly protein Flp/PilA
MSVAVALKNFIRDERGISSVEYALLLAFVGAGIVAGAVAISDAVSNKMDDAATCIEGNGQQDCSL